MTTYRVWIALDSDEADAKPIDAVIPKLAAEKCVRTAVANNHWNELPDHVQVNVRAPSGELSRWRVLVWYALECTALREEPCPG